MGGSCVRVRRPRHKEPGRPEGLPHAATIKRTAGVKTTIVCHGAWLPLCCRAAKPYRRLLSATGRTISGDFDGCNRTVGRRITLVARGLAPVRWRSRRKTGRCGGAVGMRWQVDGAASPPGGSKLPRHKGIIPTGFAEGLRLSGAAAQPNGGTPPRHTMPHRTLCVRLLNGARSVPGCIPLLRVGTIVWG
jgi:hypothetical protein